MRLNQLAISDVSKNAVAKALLSKSGKNKLVP